MPEYLVTLVKLNKEQDEHRENSFRQTQNSKNLPQRLARLIKPKPSLRKISLGKKKISCLGTTQGVSYLTS